MSPNAAIEGCNNGKTSKDLHPSGWPRLVPAALRPNRELLGIDRARRALLDQAHIRPNHCVLDIGCGTGSLVLLIKRLHPDINVVGLDPDPNALAPSEAKGGASDGVDPFR